MLIVDGQIHLWEKGTPSPQHRQEPYSAEQAIAAMDQAGVDRALIHPVLWDPDSNELAQEAVRKYPNRFAIMGWFYLDDRNGRDLVARWKERPGMLGLRFYFNERHKREWMTDGSLDWPSGPACRWRSPPRCSCRLSARSPSVTRGSN
jgi:predicted TIM-barrel fold metal-dependent hydrolase